MGYWGVKSYENDLAHDALDSAFEQVHGDAYEALMDDRNPLTFDQVQERLANTATLESAISVLVASEGSDYGNWDEIARLAYAGVVVRHAELGVAATVEQLSRAISFLSTESLEWDEATKRRLRIEREIRVLEAALKSSAS